MATSQHTINKRFASKILESQKDVLKVKYEDFKAAYPNQAGTFKEFCEKESKSDLVFALNTSSYAVCHYYCYDFKEAPIGITPAVKPHVDYYDIVSSQLDNSQRLSDDARKALNKILKDMEPYFDYAADQLLYGAYGDIYTDLKAQVVAKSEAGTRKRKAAQAAKKAATK